MTDLKRFKEKRKIQKGLSNSVFENKTDNAKLQNIISISKHKIENQKTEQHEP